MIATPEQLPVSHECAAASLLNFRDQLLLLVEDQELLGVLLKDYNPLLSVF